MKIIFFIYIFAEYIWMVFLKLVLSLQRHLRTRSRIPTLNCLNQPTWIQISEVNQAWTLYYTKSKKLFSIHGSDKDYRDNKHTPCQHGTFWGLRHWHKSNTTMTTQSRLIHASTKTLTRNQIQQKSRRKLEHRKRGALPTKMPRVTNRWPWKAVCN